MERSTSSLAGPISGIAFVGLLIASLTRIAGDPGVRPEHPAEQIAPFLGDNHGSYRVSAYLLLLGLFFLVWFLGDLHQRLRARVEPSGQWVVSVFFAGGLLLISAALVGGLITLGMSTLGEYGDDPQVARTLLTLWWQQAALTVPGAAALSGAGALLSLRYDALPAWLGAIALLSFVAALAVPWIPVYALWILATSVTLISERPHARVERPAAV